MPNRNALQDAKFTVLPALKIQYFPYELIYIQYNGRHGVSWRERRNVILGFKPNAADRQERRDRGMKRLKESKKKEMPISVEDPVQLRL